MGKYMGSPWGFIRNKLGDSVGIAWKGIDSVRVRVLPRQRGTMKDWLKIQSGTAVKGFSYPQWNVRNAAMGVLGFMARENLTTWIDPIWSALATTRKLAKTGTNLFIEKALPNFFASMPHKDQAYDAAANAPLLTALKVSEGDLEGIPSITTAEYDTADGTVHCTWPVTFTKNGAATDKVHALVVSKPLLDSGFGPDAMVYGDMTDTPAIARSDGTVGADVITIPLGLTATNLYVYLICKDAAGAIGFSDSVVKVCAAA